MSSIDTGLVTTNFPKGILHLIAQFGPSIAGIIMIIAQRGKQGIIHLFENITSINVHVKWFAMVLFFELILFHIVIFYCIVSGYGNVTVQTNHLLSSYFNFFSNTLLLALLTGLGEEIGWRGYLLPVLQSKYKILVAVLILSIANSLWHLRSDCIVMILQNDFAGFSRIYFPDMGLRMLITLPAIMVMVFVFNETKGNLLLMILYHGSANASYEWAKEITGNPKPEFLLPVFAATLWISAIYFLPAIIKQAKQGKLITQIS